MITFGVERMKFKRDEFREECKYLRNKNNAKDRINNQKEFKFHCRINGVNTRLSDKPFKLPRLMSWDWYGNL